MHHVMWVLIEVCIIMAVRLQGASLTIQGAGSTLPGQLLDDAFFAYRFAQPNVTLMYSGTTSEKGLCRLMSYNGKCDPADIAEPHSLDFAISAASIPQQDYTQYPDLQMYPVLATAVVPIYNLGTITTLALSSSTLARIFSGKITHWDDPAILQDNPDFASWQIPPRQPIIVVVRSDVAAVTAVWKKSLASFDPGFHNQIAVDQTANWPNVTTVKKCGLLGMNSHIMTTRYSIGYSVLGDATDSGLPIARIRRGGILVEASSSSIEHAVMELGISFGNNGDDPNHLTADIHNGMGVLSWPVCSYVYLVVRKTTPRNGATCQNMKDVIAFWKWFLNSEMVRNLTRKHLHGSLPEVVRETVLSQIVKDMICNGTQVDTKEEKVVIQGIGMQPAGGLFQKFSEMHSVVDSTVYVTFGPQPNAELQTLSDPLADSMFVVSSDTRVVGASDVSFAFAGVGVALVSTYSLVLDLPTLAHILDGTITKWLDPAIVALNPKGIIDGTGTAIQDGNQSIVLLRGPSGSTDILQAVMKDLIPSYTGAAIHRAPAFATEHILETAVVGTPYSLGITSLAGSHSSMTKIAHLKTTSGSTITPSWESVQRCANADVYSATKKTFSMHQSKAVDCYPLCQAVYLKVRKSHCNAMDAERTQTVSFVEWLLGSDNIDSAMQQHNMAPLRLVPEALEANAAALDFITCTPKVKSNTGILFIIIGVVVGVCVIIFGLVGVWLWRSTAQMRALKKQFSNDNVAQECAAAIACFDLDAVAWLETLETPNKIQTSFIKIIHLLTEVKPFIPDQLLASLRGTATQEHEVDDEEELTKSLCGTLPNSRAFKYEEDESHGPNNRSNSRCTAMSSCSSNSSGPTNPSHPKIRMPRKSRDISDSHGHLDVPESSGSGLCRQNWAKKRCVFLYVKFGLQGSFDDPVLLNEMAATTTALVTCCKKHGATIDKVTFNEVAVHWGVSGHVAEGPLRATLAAMEMAELHLAMSQEWRNDAWMRIGVGYGSCHVATLGAGGHRFFVVYGTEVSLPINFVTSNIQSHCRCSILISHAVYQEVQYMVKCFPRAWFHDVLLWEPVKTCADSAAMDEWMYELKKMDDQDKSELSGQTLQRVFIMAHNGDNPTIVKEAVEDIKAQFGGALSPQDIACLDYLLNNLRSAQFPLPKLADL